MLLATIGLYGVLSYGIARRTREFAIRIAIGAEGASILRMVLREAGWLLGSGIVAGLIAAWWLDASSAVFFTVCNPAISRASGLPSASSPEPARWRNYSGAARRPHRPDPGAAIRVETRSFSPTARVTEDYGSAMADAVT